MQSVTGSSFENHEESVCGQSDQASCSLSTVCRLEMASLPTDPLLELEGSETDSSFQVFDPEFVGAGEESDPAPSIRHRVRLAPLKIPDALRNKLKGKPINFVVFGKFQVGKSSLINAMFYEKHMGYRKVAKEGEEFEPTTMDIKCHPLEIDGITYHIYDTMGLQDGKNKDDKYVKEIKKIFAQAHLVIYCTKFQEPIRPDDVKALKALTDKCGKSLWEKAVIALTFANTAAPNERTEGDDWFRNMLQSRKENIEKRFLQKLQISDEVWKVVSHHIVPVGNTVSPGLPGIEDWRDKLWQECLYVCADEAKDAIFALAWNIAFWSWFTASGAAFVGGSATAGAGALKVAGIAAAASVSTVTLPVGIPVALIGLAGLVVGGIVYKYKKNTASQPSKSKDD